MRVKRIDFLHENAEAIEIDGRYIGYIAIEDLKTSIRREGCNFVGKVTRASEFAIEIHKGADAEYIPDGWDEPPKSSVFKRIERYKDLVSVNLILCDEDTGHEEEYYFFVPWENDGDREDINALQQNYISEAGNLYIVISESKKLFDIFPKERIDDERISKNHFEMLGIEE